MSNDERSGTDTPSRHRRSGQVFFVVLAAFLVMALMAFALNTFKGGAIEQLSKSIDQNRLAMLAQAANNEISGILRSQVNLHTPGGSANQFYTFFRDAIDREVKTGPITLPHVANIFPNNYTPVLTQNLATRAGYNIAVTSQAKLVLEKRTTVAGTCGFSGYLEIVSRASHLVGDQTKIELKERRDVKIVDLRHFFDRYALFVKNYCPDWNNPRRRVVVNGLANPDFANGRYSIVYVGNHYYPKCREFSDPAATPRLWFDINYAEQKNLVDPLMGILPGAPSRAAFPGIESDPFKLFFGVQNAKYWDIARFDVPAFYNVVQIKKQYRDLINRAANSILGTADFVAGTELKTKCSSAVSSSNSNSNSAAWALCEDYRTKVDGSGTNYSQCESFKQIVRTCTDNWIYRWGYSDAASFWDLTGSTRLPVPSVVTGDIRLAGLATQSALTDKVGPWMYQNLQPEDDTSNPPYNPERAFVGKMAKLFGSANTTPLLVEGNAFMRFFKVAYFDEVTATFTLLNVQVPCVLAPITLDFYKKDPVLNQDDTFLNQPSSVLANDKLFSSCLPTSPVKTYVDDRSLMSRAIDTAPVNAMLQTSNVKILKTDGSYGQYDPMSGGVLGDPQQRVLPGKTAKPGHKMYRIIDDLLCSRNYYDPQSFLRERVGKVSGKNTLYIDGYMYITEGDLDLKNIEQFAGRGLIFLGKGNCRIGNLKKKDGRNSDQTLRILLLDGDFLVDSPESDVEIHASLIANTYIPSGTGRDPLLLTSQGSFNPNNKNVTIFGNLVVDYLFTESGNAGVPMDGTLTIEHDPLIYNPAPPQYDPWRVSIGNIKTMFSMNAEGRETF